MQWVFIALAVAVVAAVAMVAVGRGSGIAPAVPDRPDVELPTGRQLTASDLSQLRFSVAVRGYRMDEVDALLVRLTSELAERVDSTPDRAQALALSRQLVRSGATALSVVTTSPLGARRSSETGLSSDGELSAESGPPVGSGLTADSGLTVHAGPAADDGGRR